MPSVRQREEFDNKVKKLLEDCFTDEQIAIALNTSIRAVGDARRRVWGYRIMPQEATEEVLIRAEEKVPRAYKVVYQGKTYWCKNEFFGIWER